MDVNRVLLPLFNRQRFSVEPLSSGRNGKVYKIILEDDVSLTAKFFYNYGKDRNRPQNTFLSLQFLWNHGIRMIPKPYQCFKTAGCVLYTYIEGKPFSIDNISLKDIETAVRFLIQVDRIKHKDKSHRLAFASEAALSLQSILDNMENRLKKFKNSPHPQLQHFLKTHFFPSFDKIIQWSRREAQSRDILFNEKLPYCYMTLSPSDFGFHNALRLKNGKMVFIDFEYFGWDDPAKMIGDFLHHPAVILPKPFKSYFLKMMTNHFSDIPNFFNRLVVIYPLLGLKWCLIFLNEFDPDQFKKCEFLANNKLSHGEILKRQLSRAKYFLEQLKHTYPIPVHRLYG